MQRTPITTHQRTPGEPPLLKGQGLTKVFGNLVANDHVDIELYPGEIHALLGENGAGKSTLMKMLYGVYQPDEGECIFEGYAADVSTPAKARAMGVGMVFQDFRLIPALSVFENIVLGMKTDSPRLNHGTNRKRILDICARYKFSLNLDRPVWQLDMGERQRVEIVKVLMSGSRILIFDEPTSLLSPAEVDGFLDTVIRLRGEGYAILLVTHKLREVRKCGDRVTILRGGKVVFQAEEISAFDDEFLIARMVGDRVAPLKVAPVQGNGHRPLVQVHDLVLSDDRGRKIIQDASFSVSRGEILGIAGISGNGQRELSEVLTGLRKPQEGTITLAEKRMDGRSPGAFFQAGVACIPDDPVDEVLVPGLNVLEHMVLAGLPEKYKGMGLDWREIRSRFDGLPERHLLKVPDPERAAETLSGGNIQRVMLAKALSGDPKLLVACYPSRGLDVSTTRTIQQLLLDRRRNGLAVILFSEDLSELFDLSDRLLVAAHGQLLGPFDPAVDSFNSVARHMIMEAAA